MLYAVRITDYWSPWWHSRTGSNILCHFALLKCIRPWPLWPLPHAQSWRLCIQKFLLLCECSHWKRMMEVLWLNHYSTASGLLQNLSYWRVSWHCRNTQLLHWQRFDSMLWKNMACWLAKEGYMTSCLSDSRMLGCLAHTQKNVKYSSIRWKIQVVCSFLCNRTLRSHFRRFRKIFRFYFSIHSKELNKIV